MVLLSCEDDGGESNLGLDVGGVPNIEKATDSPAFINLIDLQEGNEVSISYTVEAGQGNVVSMDVLGFYTKAGVTERVVLQPNVTVFPSTFTLTSADLIAKFSSLNSVDDFGLGDELAISAAVTLENGAVYDLINPDGSSNYSPGIANSPLFSVVQSYAVSCPSDLGGTYSVLTSGTSTDSGATNNPITDYPYTTTLTDDGGGNYTLSDAFGGVYIAWYTVFGLDFEVEGTIKDVCGTITGTFTDPFGAGVYLDGSVDSETGVITINWTNDFGDEGTSVYTPVN